MALPIFAFNVALACGMFIADEETNLGGYQDGVLCSVVGEMVHALTVVSQEVCDVPTALEL